MHTNIDKHQIINGTKTKQKCNNNITINPFNIYQQMHPQKKIAIFDIT